MKLSKSKLALAKVINENGGWVDDSAYAANDEGGIICGYSSKPIRRKATSYSWSGSKRNTWIRGIKTPQWHQCVLSREEYYQAYPEVTKQDIVDLAQAIDMIDACDNPKADADGWIEWKGGECPVYAKVKVDYIMVNDSYDEFHHDVSGELRWSKIGSSGDIIAYRLHKPEVKTELCESVTRSIQEPEAKPTIEQLAQDYRDKLDLANRKQLEAEDAKVVADCALAELERAGEAIGLLIGVARIDSTKAIKDWRDLMAGDEIICSEDGNWNCDLVGNVCVVRKIESTEYKGCMPILAEYGDARDWGDKFTFVRRP